MASDNLNYFGNRFCVFVGLFVFLLFLLFNNCVVYLNVLLTSSQSFLIYVQILKKKEGKFIVKRNEKVLKFFN